jgi:hypothetical protein
MNNIVVNRDKITINVVSLNPTHGEVYSIQHYVIKFVSNFQQVSGFSPGTPASSNIKTGHHDIAEILLKVALKHQKNRILSSV